MSCFRGQMQEYREIAIDRFDGGNLLCTAYFLSHCHKDHMVGLSNPAFLDRLSSRKNVFLYCTEVTRLLLLADEEYRCLRNFIQVLQVGYSQPVTVQGSNSPQDDYIVRVTPISAGHCLGSVMFLFEGCEGSSLYTGDFRWELNQASKMTALHVNESVINLRSMYIDTTFCIPEAYHIPTRSQCGEVTVALVSAWLNNSPLHVVSISCPARYGHEHLLVELARQLGTKIHVPEWRIELYANIPGLDGHFSADPRECRVHSCSLRGGLPSMLRLPCGYNPTRGEKLKILTLRPSTMWFTSENTKATAEDLVATPASGRGLHRVCYSMHSSYSEIRDIVSYLQPERVFPNVLPQSDSSMSIVQKRLNSFLSYPHKLRVKATAPAAGPAPLGALKTSRTIKPFGNFLETQSSDPSDHLVFSSPDSSPQKLIPAAAKVKMGGSRDTDMDAGKQETSDSPKSSSSVVHSSYEGSVNAEEELDLVANEGDDQEEEDDEHNIRKEAASEEDVQGAGKIVGSVDKTHEKIEDEESFRLYVSGESDVCDDDDEEEVGSEFSEYKALATNSEVKNSKLMSKSKRTVCGDNVCSSIDDKLIKQEVNLSGELAKKSDPHADVKAQRMSSSATSTTYTIARSKSPDLPCACGREEDQPVKEEKVEQLSLQIAGKFSERTDHDSDEDSNRVGHVDSDEDVIPDSQEGKGPFLALCVGRNESSVLSQYDCSKESEEEEDCSNSEPLLVVKRDAKIRPSVKANDLGRNLEEEKATNALDEEVISIKSSVEADESDATQSYTYDFLMGSKSSLVTEQATCHGKGEDKVSIHCEEDQNQTTANSLANGSSPPNGPNNSSSEKKTLGSKNFSTIKSPQSIVRDVRWGGAGQVLNGGGKMEAANNGSLLASYDNNVHVIDVLDDDDNDVEYLFDEKFKTTRQQDDTSDGWMSKLSNQEKGITGTLSLKRRNSPGTSLGRIGSKRKKKVPKDTSDAEEVVDLTND